MNILWTNNEDATIKRLRLEGLQVPAIAAAVGRKIPATYLRLRKLNVIVQPHDKWSAEDEEKLRAMATATPPMTDAVMAEALQRSVQSMRWKLSDLKLTNVRDVSQILRNSDAFAQAQKINLANQRAKRTTNVVSREALAVAMKPQPSARVAPAGAVIAIQSPSRNDGEMARRAVWRDADRKAAAATRKANLVDRARDQKARDQEKREREIHALKAQRAEAAKLARDLIEAERRKALDAKAASARQKTADRKARADIARNEAIAAKAEAVRMREEAKACRADEKRMKAEAEKRQALTIRHEARQSSLARAPTPAMPALVVVMSMPAARSDSTKAVATIPAKGHRAYGFRRGKAKTWPTREQVLALKDAAKDAVNKFVNERGITTPQLSGEELAIQRLRRRGYIVVGSSNGYIVDNRHHLPGPALIQFAEQRERS